MRLSTLDRFIQHTAVQAGQIIKSHFRQVTKGTPKSERGDLVTVVDYKAEEYIISAIRNKFPHHHILSEEAGRLEGKGNFTWVIDPLDGTNNFVKGIPIFTVVIALTKGSQVYCGAIYDPIHDELFYARQGQGSYCNGKPIHVSKESHLESMNIYISNVRLRSSLEQFAHLRSLFALYTTHYTAYGSAAYALATLASGRIDAYITGGPYPWDIAAGALLIKEAGGKITTLTGQPWQWKEMNQHVVAANPRLHRTLMKYIEQM